MSGRPTTAGRRHLSAAPDAYSRAVQLDPSNINAQTMLKKLK